MSLICAARWPEAVAGSRAAQRLVEDGRLDCPERGFLMLPAGFATLFDGGAAAAYAIFEQAGVDRRTLRRRRPRRARPPRPGPGADPARRRGGGHRAARRGDDRGHGRRGRADRDRDHLLRGHRDLPGDLRPAAGARVDDRAQRLVRGAARTGALPRPVPGAPLRGHAAGRGVARRDAGGAARLPPAVHADGAAGARPGDVPGRPSCTGCAARRPRRRPPTGRPASAGHYPQPGLALLRLAQGRADAAAAAIRGAVDGGDRSLARARVLSAYVEIMLATGDVRRPRAPLPTS